jgi:glycosyltransferase involved in cell wall biosynthesis
MTTLAPTPLQRRLHVLEVVGNAIVGGMETYVIRLCERLPRDRFQVTVMCPYESFFSERIRAMGLEVLVMPMPDETSWSSISTTCAFVEARGIDVIHCHLTNAHLLAGVVGKLTGTPVLFTNHGRQLMPSDVEAHRLTGTHVSTVCRYTELHALALGVKPAAVHLIPNGVDVDVFKPQPRRDGPLRQAMGIGPEAPLVGFIGRLSWEKGPETFLRTVLLAHQALPGVRAVMVGDGPMRGQVEGFIRNFQMQDFVHLAGLRDDIPEVLNELDLVVSTSHSEAMPLAVMEAMACGLPVVGTRVGGVPDLIQHGITGYLANDGDIDGLAQSVRTLLNDRAMLQAFGERGRALAVQRLSLAQGVQATGDLLIRLSRQGRTAAAAEQTAAANEVVRPALVKAPRGVSRGNGAISKAT